MSLSVGARHALIGPNGAGKTTLVSLVSGVLRADAGRIAILGQDVTNASARLRVKAGLARTFQVNSLFPALTVLENVLLAVSERNNASHRMLQAVMRRKELVEDAMQHLESVKLTDVADRRLDSLAYGLQRLVELAIALSLAPKILLLDEPAAGLPMADASRLLDVIDRLPAAIAVLMIEHDMHVVRRFAREVTVLASGCVLMHGAPNDVLSSPEVRRVYLGKDRQRQNGARHA